MPGLEFPPIKKAAIVPSVLGLPLAEAEKILAQAGFKMMTEGQGEIVLDQIPHGDAQVEAESNVLIYLGADASTPTLTPWWEDKDEDIEAIRSLTGRLPISVSPLGR